MKPNFNFFIYDMQKLNTGLDLVSQLRNILPRHNSTLYAIDVLEGLMLAQLKKTEIEYNRLKDKDSKKS